MAIDRDDVISVLNDLIETCEDGVKGFRAAAESIRNDAAKRVFNQRVQLIQQAEEELRAEVRRLGGTPEKHGSVGGALHRGWIDVKSAITGKDDEAIIRECERGEEVAVRNYREALEKDLPPDIHVIVERQYQGTIQNRDRIRMLGGELSSTSASTHATDREAPPPAV